MPNREKHNRRKRRAGPRFQTYFSAKRVSTLFYQIMDHANRSNMRETFMCEIVKAIMHFSRFNEVELWFKEEKKYHITRIERTVKRACNVEAVPCIEDERGIFMTFELHDSELRRLCKELIRSHDLHTSPLYTQYGSLIVDAAKGPASIRFPSGWQADFEKLTADDNKSLAIIPIVIEGINAGLLLLMCRSPRSFPRRKMDFFEMLAQTLGIAIVHRYSQFALRERIKELTSLGCLAKIAAQPGITMDELLRAVVELLPPAWLYPEITCAKVILDGKTYSTAGFRNGVQQLAAAIVVNNENRGIIEVHYLKEKPERDEGPFLREERNLLDTVAQEISVMIERKQTEADRAKLQEQLRHADRLATIGQLAAGVAHELNEPLGTILGFAQLARKNDMLPADLEQDIERIVKATLHAREVIKKLMLFSRQMPTKKSLVDLNQVIKETIYFLGARCAKEGIDLILELSPDLPNITADPAQLSQVIVNLIVNAIQAMSKGGILTVKTNVDNNHLLLAVEDTGSGMTDEVKKQIFIPFFTTKEIGEGTGLGLSVVHGIVDAHNGSINVMSELNHGSRFEIRLPVARIPRTEENTQNGSIS